MSIIEDVRDLKTSKNLIRTSIANKGEIIPENTKLELYPYYIDKLKIKGDSEQINEQIPNPVTNIAAEIVDNTSMKISWKAPSDNVAGYDIAITENVIPSFPLDETQIASVSNADTTDITFNNLIEGNTYGFLVMSKNSNGLRQTCINKGNSILRPWNAIPCYVKEVNVQSLTGTISIFYTVSGEVIVYYTSNTTTKYYMWLNGSGSMEGVEFVDNSRESGSNYLNGNGTFVIVKGVTKPCTVTVSPRNSSSNLDVTFTELEAENVTDYIVNTYIEDIIYTGNFATPYYFTEAGTRVGYSKEGEIVLVVQSGTNTSNPNIHFKGDNVGVQTQYKGNHTMGVQVPFGCILKNITSRSNLELNFPGTGPDKDVYCYVNLHSISN